MRVMTHVCATLLLVVSAGCGGGGGSPAAPQSPGVAPSAAPPPDATVGSAGGTVAGLGGGVQLVVPAGALGGPTGITIRALAAAPVDPRSVTGSAVEILPAGTRFAVPARLTVRYDPSRAPSGIGEEELQVHTLLGTAWEAAAGGTIDAAVHEASAPVSATGSFGVRWSGPRNPCASAEDRQFDFWLGNWSFSAPGAFPGTDDVTRDGTGCVLEEVFRDSQTLGRSISLFSRRDRRWHQTYVDSVGGRLVLVGASDGRRMVLLASPTERFVWEPLGADTVRYAGERTSDGGLTWNVAFDARYVRR